MSSVKTDVNPSDIGTKAQRRAHLASGTVATSDSASQWILVVKLDESNDRHM